jgi:molybdopterin-dependent oxidoreductase alpha subunit
MRTYSEQLFLLLIDPVTGRYFPVPEKILNLTLAGALLFDASFRGLINDDWENLTVLKMDETGLPALDETIGCLGIIERPIPLTRAVELVAAHGETLSRMVFDSLMKKGFLTRKKQSIIANTRKQEFILPDVSHVVAIHKQIRDTILQDEIPEYQIPPLISLIEASGLTKYILNPDEIDSFKEKIAWLAGMESLGREIIRSVHLLETADLEKDVTSLIGLSHDQPKTFAGGIDAVLTSLNFLYKETGMKKSRKIIGHLNQLKGFECPGCAWPNPDKHRSRFEFCENGAKNVSAEATTRMISSDFFTKWSVPELLLTSGYWLEQQGRLTEPMLLEEDASHYKPIEWNEAYRMIADELTSLNHPDEAVFYASGRTSNEAGFLYQLFARTLGTNNLPNSANICHEPSGKALTEGLGFGKSSVSLEDFSKTDLIFLLGHNPGSNHPRMLSTLLPAVRRGCKIVAVNPMPEASLLGFADPQEAVSYLGKQNKLAHLCLQPRINGDMALIRGMVKAMLEKEEEEGGVLDGAFIEKYTVGFKAYRDCVMATSWERIVQASGIKKSQILETADLYMEADKTISCWCLGITHHRNSMVTIREIVNLMLLKGNLGRPGAGVLPVRGHSNIQGIRTAGVGENMPATFLDSLEKIFPMKAPRKPGMSVIPAIQSMAEGKIRVLISLGGNLASAVPDTAYVEKALQKCRLTVMISTKLNRSHLVTGKRALILPCLSRSDEDIREGVRQYGTVEDAMAKIGFTQGCFPPGSLSMKSEVSIIAAMAEATFNNHEGIDWQWLGKDNNHIRQAMSQTIPAFKGLDKQKPTTQGYYLWNPLRKRIFNTHDAKAHFSDAPLERVDPEPNELLLMTIRSHDQFNTSVFGLNDRYRGIQSERRVLFMNRKDMDVRNIAPEQMVTITSNYDRKVRKLEGYYAIPYPIRNGCVAAYFPETNWLTSINDMCVASYTPAFKSIRVCVDPGG